MTEPLLSVEGLKKYFPIRRNFLPGKVEFVKAVDGVTFQIEQGETLFEQEEHNEQQHREAGKARDEKHLAEQGIIDYAPFTR